MIRRRSCSAGRTWAIARESISCGQRRRHSEDEEPRDDSERQSRSGFPPPLEDELQADEDEHDGDRLVEIAEAAEQLADENEERGKAEQREDVPHPDEERVSGDREACGDRVDRE